jgi:hypothetical protein
MAIALFSDDINLSEKSEICAKYKLSYYTAYAWLLGIA